MNWKHTVQQQKNSSNRTKSGLFNKKCLFTYSILIVKTLFTKRICWTNYRSRISKQRGNIWLPQLSAQLPKLCLNFFRCQGFQNFVYLHTLGIFCSLLQNGLPYLEKHWVENLKKPCQLSLRLSTKCVRYYFWKIGRQERKITE